jgi:hypothetical protein
MSPPLRHFAASPQGDAPFGPAKPVLRVPWAKSRPPATGLSPHND